jgi:hypothetical protein
MHYLVGLGKLGGMTTAAERLLVPGPEEKQLAERTMIGLYLQEIMRPAPAAPDRTSGASTTCTTTG